VNVRAKKVTLTNSLGKQPENQMLEGRVVVAKFSLVTSESYKFMMNEQPKAE